MQFVREIFNKIKIVILNIAKFFCGAFFVVKNSLIKAFKYLKNDVLEIVDECVSFYNNLKERININKTFSKLKPTTLVSIFFETLKKHKKMLVGVTNYLLPLVLLIVAIFVINFEISKTYAIEITYNNTVMGNIKDEEVYLDSISKVGEIIMDSDQGESFIKTPKYKMVYTRPSEMIDSDTLAENIISVSGDILEDASGLFVDGEFIGATKNGSDIRSMLETIRQSASNYYGGGVAEIQNTIEIKSGMYPDESLTDTDTLAERLTGRSQSGMLTNGYMIGGLLSVSVTTTKSYVEDVPYSTVEQAEEYFEIGYEKIDREGKMGKRSVLAAITYLNGREENRKILESETLEEPINEIKIVGARMPDNAEELSKLFKDKFAWPVNGGYLSSMFMTEDRPTHKALDIAAASGTDIYAADNGTVIFSGVSDDGAGLNVMIQHSDGFSTRYAHCSALYVLEGQPVVKGQIIAAIGRTGTATGNHLHFEIRYNGYRLDPMPFVKQ